MWLVRKGREMAIDALYFAFQTSDTPKLCTSQPGASWNRMVVAWLSRVKCVTTLERVCLVKASAAAQLILERRRLHDEADPFGVNVIDVPSNRVRMARICG